MKGFRAGRQPIERADAAPLDLAEVYDEYADRVHGWVARLVGPSLDAEDLVHEVFLIVRDRLSTFRGEAKLSTWLYRIAANVARDRRRRDARRRFRQLLVGEATGTAPARPTPLEDLERRRDAELVYRVLDSMKDTYRTVLILHELEGHSGEEIAELTGRKLDTIWVWLHRARAQFRERLARLEPAYRWEP